ncbi:MAG TPA: erythromycin esterase family protein [Xanthobacteraceae bacterium]|nr:erythromycin esterase family protein [Xanthobacteraceae bacterium]
MSDQEQLARLAIESQYARLSEAVRHRDLDALRALHTFAYSELQITGEERDLAEVMAEWRADLADVIEPSLKTEIQGFDLDGDEASVTICSVRAFITSFAALRFSNRIETTGRDYWINTGVGWRLSRSERRAIKSWVDDKLDAETRFEPLLTAEQRAAVVRDLCVHALPFKSVHAGNGFDDLTGLDRLIGDARLVALGEATHGTAEFFQMKHRLLEYLVERKGFTVFAIEGNWPEAQEADRFIKTGEEGDAAAALAAMYFWTWQTEEVSALLHWMRHYNVRRGERPIVSFTGFDMQNPNVAMNRVIDFLDRTSCADRDVVRALYDGLDKPSSEIPEGEKTRLRDRANKAFDLVEARRETLVTASTPEEYRDIRQAARIVLQAFARRAGIPGAERDRAMAENVRWLIEEAFPGQKVVLWAHNGHVGTDMGSSEKSLGNHLRDRYGDQMVVIGFATHHGEVRARRRGEGGTQPSPLVAAPLAPIRKVSVEALFQETGLPRFILDLRYLPKDSAVSTWLSKPRLHRMIGAVYDSDRDSKYYALVRLPEMYDCIVFIAESTAAKPLRR